MKKKGQGARKMAKEASSPTSLAGRQWENGIGHAVLCQISNEKKVLKSSHSRLFANNQGRKGKGSKQGTLAWPC